MGKRVGNDITLGPHLYSVVTNGLGCIHCFLKIARFKYILCFLCIMCPYPCKKIGIKLNPHTLLIAPSLVKCSQQILYMMTNFMSYDVCCSKVALGSQLSLKFVKEIKVDIYFLIARTIKRSCGRLCIPAGRFYTTAEKYQLRLPVVIPLFSKRSFHTSSSAKTTAMNSAIPFFEVGTTIVLYYLCLIVVALHNGIFHVTSNKIINAKILFLFRRRCRGFLEILCPLRSSTFEFSCPCQRDNYFLSLKHFFYLENHT